MLMAAIDGVNVASEVFVVSFVEICKYYVSVLDGDDINVVAGKLASRVR
jgi:hypothetical protein